MHTGHLQLLCRYALAASGSAACRYALAAAGSAACRYALAASGSAACRYALAASGSSATSWNGRSPSMVIRWSLRWAGQ